MPSVNAYSLNAALSSTLTKTGVTVSAGQAILVKLYVANWDGTGFNNPIINGVTFNGVALTKYSEESSTSGNGAANHASVWYGSPSAATASVVASLVSPYQVSAMEIEVITDPGSPLIRSVDFVTGDAASEVSNAITTVSGDLVTDWLRWRNNSGTYHPVTAGSGQTELIDEQGPADAENYGFVASYEQATGTSTTMSYTLTDAGSDGTGFVHTLVVLTGAGATPTITLTPAPASVQVGSARTFTATRSAAAGAGGVTYNVSSSNPSVATVPTPQALTEADSDLTFDATGVSVGTANITITNAADSSETDTVALTVTAVTTKKAKFLVHPDFASATGITIEVNEAPTGGALTGAKLGFTTGVAAEATLEGGQAVIKVNAADVGASALAAATNVVAIFKGTTSASSPLGNAVEGGSVATAAGTIIEE